MRGLGVRWRWHRWPAAGFLARAVWPRQALVLLRRTLAEFRADHCAQFAAAISFHLLFSVFPLAITAVGIIGLVTQDPHARDTVLGSPRQVWRPLCLRTGC